ncbi:hypothetical protein TIFTF001_052783 [Ficus carica]|uniref:Uncharacterized protein n=1 Tax=Ficus carica TaxID=3494 RepID=A0AA88EDU2_FICCA|nr:hypothetical protein TIFTF001_052783 [Ficus carica]
MLQITEDIKQQEQAHGRLHFQRHYSPCNQIRPPRAVLGTRPNTAPGARDSPPAYENQAAPTERATAAKRPPKGIKTVAGDGQDKYVPYQLPVAMACLHNP